MSDKESGDGAAGAWDNEEGGSGAVDAWGNEVIPPTLSDSDDSDAPLIFRIKGRGKISQISTLDDAISFLGFRRCVRDRPVGG